MTVFASSLPNQGRLEVICGSMFSGKTEELMRRLRRADYAQQRVITIKHHIDTRVSKASIISHDGQQRLACTIEGKPESLAKIIELASGDASVVGIDEVQFFPPEIVQIIHALITMDKRVIAAGLDLDFRGEPFGVMPILLALADDVEKLKAICVICGADAHHTQRIINGIPARFADPIILVGAREAYEARCRRCFIIDKPDTPLHPAIVEAQQTALHSLAI